MDSKTNCGNGHMKPVTEPQKKVLAFYMAYEEDNGRPPTLKEAAAFFGVSRQGILFRIRKLQAKGLMEGGGLNKPRDKRSYRPTIGRVRNEPRDDG